MTTRRPPIAALLMLAGLLAWAVPAWASPWLRAESRHFSMLAQTSPASAEQHLQALERQHEVMLMTLGVPERLSGAPTVLVLVSDASLATRLDPAAGPNISFMGFRGVDGSYFLAVDMQAESDRAVFSGYPHRVALQHARPGQPLWYTRGFGAYFAGSRIGRDEIEIGVAAQWVQVLGQRRWLEATELLKPDLQTPNDKWELFSAQAWLLTHYALSSADRMARFNDYLRRLAAGEDAVAAFEPAIGIAPERLMQTLRHHLRTLGDVRIPAKGQVAVHITPLPEAQALAELDGVGVAIGPKAAHGQLLLKSLRERVAKAGGDRAPDTMRWALAHAEIRYGSPEQALLLLAPWAQQDAPPFEANRLLGWAWQAEAERVQGADRDVALQQARSFLISAHKQRRDDAPTLYQLARVLQHGGPSASLSNAAESASVLEPLVTEYDTLAVQVHLQAGDRAKALRGLRALAANLPGENGARARAALQALQSNCEATDVLALLNGTEKATSP